MSINRRHFLFATAAGATALGCSGGPAAGAQETFAVTHTDEEWRRILPPAAYEVLRHEGTERTRVPFISASSGTP